MKNLPFISLNNNELIVFGLLTMAIISIWIPWKIRNRKYAYGSLLFFSFALMFAIFYGYVDPIAVPIILVFALGFILLRQGQPGVVIANGQKTTILKPRRFFRQGKKI